jgi:hypothetical protein
VFAGAANVGIIAGAVLATAGVVVWLVAPGTEKACRGDNEKARAAKGELAGGDRGRAAGGNVSDRTGVVET